MVGVDKPISFNDAEVQATLERRKTQARRVIREAPEASTRLRLNSIGHLESFIGDIVELPEDHEEAWQPVIGDYGCDTPVRCPYGASGGRLWVRETWRTGPVGQAVLYRATDSANPAIRWRPSAHMPRSYSRISLELTDVRVQRAQDISEDDAIAEGVDAQIYPGSWRQGVWSKRQDFAQIWNHINAKRGYGWETNPWVWVLTFKRVEQAAPSMGGGA